MAKNNAYSAAGGGHGLEGGPTWDLDQTANKGKSKAAGIQWQRKPSRRPKKKAGDLDGPVDPDKDDPNDRPEGDLRSNESLLELFRSNISALRTHPFDDWGYRISRPMTAADGAGPGVLPDPDTRKAGRPVLRDSITILRDLAIGEPAIDFGSAALVKLPSGDTKIKPEDITHEMEKGHPYVRTLGLAAQILATYDHPEHSIVVRKKKKKKPRKSRSKKTAKDEGDGEAYDLVPGKKIADIDELEEVPKIVLTPRHRLAKGVTSNLHRKTVDVSPGLSRSIQMMLEHGLVKEARKILDDLIIPLGERFEKIFPNSKVVCAGWHVRSGQLHLDLWVHSTRLEAVLTGVKRTPETARFWDKYALCHFGNGPGICAMNRHVAALGEEAADLCPGVVDEVREAIARAEERGAQRETKGRGAGLANRDIAIHEAFDEMVSAALPSEFVAQGMEVYRDYLREFYLAGGDEKMKPEHEDEMELSIAARLYQAKKAQGAAEAAREAAENAQKAAETALKRAEDAARKEAAPILAAAKQAEAALPSKVAEAEISIAQKAFERVLPGQKPESGTVDGILGEIDLRLEVVREKAGMWDRVVPLLKRAFRSMTGEARNILDKGLAQAAAQASKPDSEIKMWGAMLARVSCLVEAWGIGKAKGKAAGEMKPKEGDPPQNL